MKLLVPFTSLLLAACATPPVPTQAPQPADLNGVWDVTLYWSPTEPPSATVMELAIDGGGKLSGSFYGSEFLEAEYALRGNTLAFGSVTTDADAPYSHSGRLVNGRIEGQTLSQGRDFLMIWEATRRPDPPPE